MAQLEGKASEFSCGDGWVLGSPINMPMELNDLLGVVGIQEYLLCCNLWAMCLPLKGELEGISDWVL